MKFPRRKFLHLAAGAAVLPAMSRIASAQAYPTRPVHIIVGFAAGGAIDIIARLTGQWLSERLGQHFIVENRAGAGGNIGTEAVVKSTPDGYTLLMVANSAAINATLYDKLNFVFLRDITPMRASPARHLSWRYIHRSRPRRFPSSSPMPRPIRAKSTWRPPVTEPVLTSPGNCLRC